ncbi:PXA domain-containing protein [Gaertneriomyces semiglobifer]|nr:PXA domain-containing protein [Gaertneriomyces semiglobifer]
MASQRVPGTPTIGQMFNNIRPEKFTSSAIVDAEIAEILIILLRDYVCSWYHDISHDEAFLKEIVDVVAFAVRQLEQKYLNNFDWVLFLSKDLPELLGRHVQDFRRCKESHGTMYSGDRTFEELFHGCQPHCGLDSPESEAEYYRRVVELLLSFLLPPEELKSDSVRFVAREILTNAVIRNCVETISDPNFINRSIIQALTGKDGSSISSLSPQKAPTDGLLQSTFPILQPSLDVLTPPSHQRVIQGVTKYSGQDFLFTLQDLPPASLKRRRRERSPHKVPLGPAYGVGFVTKLAEGLNIGFEKVHQGLGRIKETVSPKRDKSDGMKRHRQLSPTMNTDDPVIEWARGAADVVSDHREGSSQTFCRNFSSLEEKAQGKRGGYDSDSSTSTDSFQSVASEAQIQPASASFNRSVNGAGIAVDVLNTNRPCARLIPYGSNFWNKVVSLFQEVRDGPRFIGSIDTKKYEGSNLDDPILDLITDLLQSDQRSRWLYTQLLVFARPIVHSLFTRIINRAIIYRVHLVTSEVAVSKYLATLRHTLWPSNVSTDDISAESAREEQEETRARARSLLLRHVGSSWCKVLGLDAVDSAVSDLFDMLQHQYINKHFVFLLIDTIMQHLEDSR